MLEKDLTIYTESYYSGCSLTYTQNLTIQGEIAFRYASHTPILLSYREVVSICMRLPFALESKATQQIICRLELMLIRLSMIFVHLPVKSNSHP